MVARDDILRTNLLFVHAGLSSFNSSKDLASNGGAHLTAQGEWSIRRDVHLKEVESIYQGGNTRPVVIVVTRKLTQLRETTMSFLFWY